MASVAQSFSSHTSKLGSMAPLSGKTPHVIPQIHPEKKAHELSFKESEDRGPKKGQSLTNGTGNHNHVEQNQIIRPQGKSNHTKTAPPKNPSAQTPPPSGSGAVQNSGSAATRLDVMHLTALGAHILSSSVNPVAAIDPPRDSVLATVKTIPTVDTTPDVQVQSPLPTIAVKDTTAPQKQPHSDVWSTAIQAAQDGQGLQIGDDPIHNTGIATVADNGNIVKLPLASVANAGPEDLIPVETTAATPLVVTGTLTGVTSNAPLAAVDLPPALAANSQAVDASINPALTTPPGFVLTGELKLFNVLDAERFVFQGTTAIDNKNEMVIPKTAPLGLDTLVHNYGISFGDIELAKPSISYYSQQVSNGRGPGLWLDATVDLKDGLAEVGTDIKDLFGHDTSDIAISAALGDFDGWSSALKLPPDFTLQASLLDLHAKFGKLIEFSSTQITSQAYLVDHPKIPGHQIYAWGHLFSGQLLLITPGSVTPLLLDFSLTRKGTTYSLDMHLHQSQTWVNALGVPGLNLFDVHFSAKFDKANGSSGLSFQVTATLKVETANLDVTGNYSEDDWSLTATLDRITWAQLDELYSEMFGSHLHTFDHNITFQDLQLEVSSKNNDLVLKGHINVDDWCKLQAEIKISSRGFYLEASIDEAKFEHVTITQAKLQIFVGKQGDIDPNPAKPGTSSSFTISGKIKYLELQLDATVYIDKDPKLGLLWAVYAKCDIPLNLSHLLNLGSRSDLDLILENVALMAANADTLGPMMPTNLDYKVKSGFQLCAKIDTPRAIAKALNSSPSGLIVQADLASGQKSVDLLFTSPQSISLKPGLSAPAVKAGIVAEDTPTLFLEADLEVQLNGQPGPLTFALRLDANVIEATAEAELKTDWMNPFGISPKVKVLSPVSLGVEIVYASGVYPSGVTFQGGFQVGKTEVKAAFKVTDNPKEGVLLVDIENIGIQDIIAFASDIAQHQLPQPPSDFLIFQDLDLSLSTGANIGATFYPAGATFAAEMTLFGKTASVHCQIDKSPPGISITGTVQSFSLGPLSVTGHTGKDLSLDLKFGSDEQHVMIDGEIRLWELDAAVTIRANLHPLDLSFDSKFAFSDALEFHLSAQIQGEVHSLKDLAHCDFTFDCELEQHIVDYLMAHANSYILTAKKAADEGLDSAKQKLADAQKGFNDVISQKQKELDATKAAWDKQNAATTAAAEVKKKQVLADEANERKKVDEAKAKLDAFINDLEKKFDRAREDADREIKKAEKTLSDEKAKIDHDIDEKVQKLHEAQESLSRDFGNADRALEDAQNKVNSAQHDLDNSNQEVEAAQRDWDNAHWYEKVTKGIRLGELKVEHLAKQAALDIVDKILSAAKNIVDGAGYKLAHGAVSLAQDALNEAKKISDGTLDTLNKGLEETRKAQDALVKAAEKDLEEAKKECDASKVWDAAKEALNKFLETKAALIADADKAIEGLKSCAEKIAYDAASAAIGIARAGTKEIELAQHAVSLVEEGFDGIAALGQWMIKNVGNIFNIKKIKLAGTLGAAMQGKPLVMAIDGEFADASVNFEVDFVPGKAEEMMKEAFSRIMEEVKKDASAFVKKI